MWAPNSFQQISLIDKVNNMPEYLRKILINSWAHVFQKVIFPYFLHRETEGKQSFHFANGQIIMGKVDFSYCENQLILHDFSLIIKPGEKVAIVGASGKGKSTVFDLMRGMQFPKRGDVQVDGMAVSPENAPSLREQIASVS